jgi:hypothetical protein
MNNKVINKLLLFLGSDRELMELIAEGAGIDLADLEVLVETAESEAFLINRNPEVFV